MTGSDPEERLRRLVHDLRTPLAVVLGFAELLARDPDALDARRREFVERIAEGAEELRAILDEAAQAARSASTEGGEGK